MFKESIEVITEHGSTCTEGTKHRFMGTKEHGLFHTSMYIFWGKFWHLYIIVHSFVHMRIVEGKLRLYMTYHCKFCNTYLKPWKNWYLILRLCLWFGAWTQPLFLLFLLISFGQPLAFIYQLHESEPTPRSHTCTWIRKAYVIDYNMNKETYINN